MASKGQKFNSYSKELKKETLHNNNITSLQEYQKLVEE